MVPHQNSTNGLYLSVQPIRYDLSPDSLVYEISTLLPDCADNKAYLSAITDSTAPIRSKMQRYAALACFLSLLKEITPHALDTLHLRRDECGRPYGMADSLFQAMDFNLTHTDGWVACALLLGNGRVGVDIEKTVNQSLAEKLARRFFTDDEKNRLSIISSGEKYAKAITRLWTIKEALAKQNGGGYPMRFDACHVPSGLGIYSGTVSHPGHSQASVSVCAPATALSSLRMILPKHVAWTT